MEDMYLAEDMYQEGDSSNKEEEEDSRETSMKLSVTHVIKRDISVAIVPSMYGTNNKARDERQ